ncbi:MAG: Na/Pi cotransporter family protein [Bacteroidales bacterium]|jgi:phosphate:Na+ symporter|nr:Na/Pi cotransporter family protein [Bacteroidales bacterium]
MVLLSSIESTTDISWFFLIIGLLGGLVLFLYGMEKMSEGLKKTAGKGMRKILATLTNNRLIGLAVGAFVTMVIQSSSATTVMLVSFAQAQLLTFGQTLSVILGANIGTTVTAQLIAFKLTDYAFLMIIIGFALTVLSKKEYYKYLGESLLGFGILFMGMKIMSDSMYPLREYEPFIGLMKNLENPIFGLLLGAAFTALIQSSSAFTGIVIVLAQQGLLTLDAGIPLLFGANIGTCVTAALASIGATREAKRVAIAHVIFNTAGALIFLFWIPYFADIVRWISPVSDAEGVQKLASEAPRQIANAHTLFNVSVAILFLPFTSLLAKLVLKIMPERDTEKPIESVTWHLDEKEISTPAIAIDLSKAEVGRMAKILRRMLRAIIHPLLSNEEGTDSVHKQLTIIEGIEMREGKIDFLHKKVTSYLLSIGREELTEEQSKEVFNLILIVRDMEAIGDIIYRNMFPLIKKKRALKFDFSREGHDEIETYHAKIYKQLDRLEETFSDQKYKKAKKIVSKENRYADLAEEFKIHHLQRLQQQREETIATHEIHMEIMDNLKQISVYITEIARSVVIVEYE